jgi:branched-chain amino acid transport system permease protein
VGGLVLGVTQNLAGTYIGSDIDIAVAFLAIILVLIARPTGLFGKRAIESD